MKHNRIEKKNESEWEGFQYEHETFYLDHERFNNIEGYEVFSKKIKNKLGNKKSSLDLKHQHKKQLPKLDEKSNNLLSPQLKHKFQLFNQQKKKYLHNQYARIPILKNQDRIISSGVIVYKGMTPKTADRYFTYLKEVNFQSLITKEYSSKQLTFNSNFEC